MLVSGQFLPDDRQLRRLYVGMTRAKTALHIHTDSSLFSSLGEGTCQVDAHRYPMPTEVVLSLTHKDVYLDFFKQRKDHVLSLRSGEELYYSNSYLEKANKVRVAFLSHKMQEELSRWKENGYTVSGASVRFIVAWKEVGKDPEIPIILPDLTLTLCQQSEPKPLSNDI